jgi:hypothetical protein
MTKLTKDKAIKVIQNNLEYLDDVVEAAIVNLLEDEGDNDFVLELQYIYDTYVGREKYGKQLT